MSFFRIRAVLSLLLLGFSLGADAQQTDSAYPRAYQSIIDAARGEGQFVLYRTSYGGAAISKILAAFKKKYPFLAIHDNASFNTSPVDRFVSEIKAGQPTADFMWNSGMSLQEKLINDGYAQPYESPESPRLAYWAHWQDLGYSITLEPVVFVYNSRFLSPQEMPNTHTGLVNMLRHRPQRYKTRVATFDPTGNNIGMLFYSQDIKITRDTWKWLDTFGSLDAKAYATNTSILRSIESGKQWIGYNVISSLAVDAQKRHPELVVVYPTDYLLVMSRVGFITTAARHPNAAKLFLDFLLSREAQTMLRDYRMGSVRTDIGFPHEQVGVNAAQIHAIRLGPGLLSDLDTLVQAQFVRRWNLTGIKLAPPPPRAGHLPAGTE